MEESQKEHLKNLISIGKTKEAIDTLKILCKHTSFYNEIIHQSAEYEEYKKAQRIGNTSLEEQRRSISNIRDSLLQIIDQLPGKQSAIRNVPKKSRRKYWWIVFFFMLAIVAIIIGFYPFGLGFIGDRNNDSIGEDTTTVVQEKQKQVEEQAKSANPYKGDNNLTPSNEVLSETSNERPENPKPDAPSRVPTLEDQVDTKNSHPYQKEMPQSIRIDKLNKHVKVIYTENLIWMAENLNYTDYTIHGESWCLQNKQKNCDEYGRLYTWDGARKACEAIGWVLPQNTHWQELISAFNDNPYEQLIYGGKSGFNSVLGGRRNTGGSFFHDEAIGYYWSASKKTKDVKYYYRFNSSTKSLSPNDGVQSDALSCRCVKPKSKIN